MLQNINHKNVKKPFYKKWWVWVIVVAVIIGLANMGSDKSSDDNKNNDTDNIISEESNDTNNNTEDGSVDITKKPIEDNTIEDEDSTIIEDQYEDEVADEVSDDTIVEETTAFRNNSSAELTVLNTGNFVVGTDIPAGRYVITGDGSGNLFISGKSEVYYVNEILGGGEFGIKSVTTDIRNGDLIEISGINNVTFTPAETVLYTDSLTTGTWIVGLDIAPGRYDIISEDENGNLFIYDTTGWIEVNEILGGEYGVEKVTTNLEDGYTITISGMNKVNFTVK